MVDENINIKYGIKSILPLNNDNAKWLSPEEYMFEKPFCPSGPDCFTDDLFPGIIPFHIIKPEFEDLNNHIYEINVEPAFHPIDGNFTPGWTFKNWKNGWDNICCNETTWIIYDEYSQNNH